MAELIDMSELSLKSQFVELKARGLSERRISVELGIDRRRLAKWRDELANDINNEQVAEYEKVLSKYHLRKVDQLEQAGELMEKLRHELKVRDLTDLDSKDVIAAMVALSQFTNKLTEGLHYKNKYMDQLSIQPE